CSLYGIADLELLVGDDHKFESRYTFSLVANLPEGREVFIERSPIHHIERLTAPVILFQGTEDLVVPANQAEVMAAALDARGVPHSAVFFAGEGHGFRQADNIVRCLEAELSFYAQTLGFPHPEGVDPVEVKHL
ncbi:MAG: prolyl oligopeptidase family serine peptidase, partial [Microthrixaceae bacterium]|nr:prolyl oligopeptidase family serine peptidase [Microthrixaceae bacterium]